MLVRIELSVPVAKEKEMTPINITMMHITYSSSVPPEISPNPTVVMVVKVK